MLGKTNRFDNSKPNLSNQQIILKRTPSKHVNLIMNQEMKASFNLNENVMVCSEFEVSESGYFHVSSQMTVKNSSNDNTVVEYFQFGVCKNTMSDYQENLKSSIMNSICQPDYVISDSLCCIMQLEKDVKYQLWVNFGCENASKFQFQSEYSNLRLYKL